MPVLGDVFAPLELLPVQCRLRLMEMLAPPGSARAILPRQLAELPLPVDQEVLSDICAAIESGLDRSVLAVLGSFRLGSVVPALARAGQDALIANAPRRLRGPLSKHAAAQSVTDLTVDQISGWSGFGTARVIQVIGAAVAAGIEAARRPDDRLALFDTALSDAGDGRDRGVFENAVLAPGPPVSRTELADALGISVDRVRRLAARATHRVFAAIDQSPQAIQLAASVSEQLGVAAPLTAADGLLAALRWPTLSDTRSRLLLSTAGPYREVDGYPGWLVRDGSQVVAETRRLIREDQGVRPVEHVVAELHMVGVAPEHTENWLIQQPVRISHGLVVALTGSTGDVAERALHAQGRALSAAELSQWAPAGAVQALLTARDRRFQLTSNGSLALVEWGKIGDVASA